MPLDPILGLDANTIVLVDVDYQAASFRMNLLALPQRDKNELELLTFAHVALLTDIRQLLQAVIGKVSASDLTWLPLSTFGT